jgi:hypothetical protein
MWFDQSTATPNYPQEKKLLKPHKIMALTILYMYSDSEFQIFIQVFETLAVTRSEGLLQERS